MFLANKHSGQFLFLFQVMVNQLQPLYLREAWLRNFFNANSKFLALCLREDGYIYFFNTDF